MSDVFPVRPRGTDGRRVMDLVWALINSAEFLYRH